MPLPPSNSSSRILFLEGATGISGDMTVAALLDLGADRRALDAALNSLGLPDIRYRISAGKSCGLSGCSFDVMLPHSGGDGSSPAPAGDAAEPAHPHHHPHGHRHLHEIYAIIERGDMTERARGLAKRIFRIVAEAEGEAHGLPPDEVHFHEVGAVDSIADIVGTAVLIDSLGIADCIVPPLPAGSGFVHCQHGVLPVPVPAVVNIARQYAMPLRDAPAEGELVTPTGIAIAAALRTRDSLPARYRLLAVGNGLGKRDIGRPNILRAMLVEEQCPSEEQLLLLECTIDDAGGETLGLALEQLMKAGALEAHYVPCCTKKSRPAWLLRVLAVQSLLPELEAIIFAATTTIGIRRMPVERSCMQRQTLTVQLAMGAVEVKRCRWNSTVRNYPEYESVKQLSSAAGIPFTELYRLAQEAADALQ